MDRRCVSCHTEHAVLPRAMSDEREVSFWSFDINDPRMPLSRHIVFNLTRPENSLLLLAALAEEAGGLSLCQNPEGEPAPTFTSRDDPDYQVLLAMIEAGRDNLQQVKRFDMPDYQPPMPYIREMRRYGILPEDFPDDKPVDFYALDQDYWRSFWYEPRSR